MQIKVFAAVMLTFFVFVTCEKEEEFIATADSEMLTGYWVNRQYNDTIFTCERMDMLVADDYGFAFLAGGKFIERKNSGWCGTPPIAYTDFEGSWSLSDSIVHVAVGYWGGTANYRWQVVFVDDERLKIEVIFEDYSQEI